MTGGNTNHYTTTDLGNLQNPARLCIDLYVGSRSITSVLPFEFPCCPEIFVLLLIAAVVLRWSYLEFPTLSALFRYDPKGKSEPQPYALFSYLRLWPGKTNSVFICLLRLPAGSVSRSLCRSFPFAPVNLLSYLTICSSRKFGLSSPMVRRSGPT